MTTANRSPLQTAKRWNPAWMLLVAAILTATLGYVVWEFTRSRATAQARVELEHRVSQIDIKIRERMQDYAYALVGMATLFAGDTQVNRAQWHNQYKLLHIEEKFPGFQGIGYAPLIPRAAKAQFERALRDEGFADAVLRPEGERDVYVAVKYLEPAIERHVRAIAHDMYHEPLRRVAMDLARDQARAVITGKLTLALEEQEDRQPGFLMYQPVYRRGAAISNETERRAAIEGYVFSTFRTLNLMRGILDEVADIRIEIFDGRQQREDMRLYDSVRARGTNPSEAAPLLKTLSTIPVHGRIWSLCVSTLPGFESRISMTGPMIATTYATAICVLLFGLIWLLYTRRQHAVELAGQMTGELAESRERLSLALDGSNLALFDWNVATGQVHLSERWNAILGGEPQPTTITIQAFEQMVHPDDVKALVAQFHAVLKGNTPRYEVEHRVKGHDGAWRWVLSRGKVMEHDAQGRVLRLVGTNADITRRKDVEHVKNEFIATVSHELRTPLTALIGSLGLLRQGALGKLPDKAQPFLDMAHQNGERLAALINDMLDLEKLESGQLEFRIEPLALASLLNDAVMASTDIAKKSGVRLELATVPASLSMLADRDRTLQVLANLLSNAVKFAPAGSAVTISPRQVERGVRVSVTDRGPGVPADFAGRIFGKFAQADGSSTREIGGTGLGLALSKIIIETMNGQIGYISEPGSGTTFYFDLPLAPAS